MKTALSVIVIALAVLCGAVTADYCQAAILSKASIANPLPGQLLLVQVLTRHGDRTPLTLLPNDDSVWNCTLNSLNIFDTTRNPSASPQRLYRQVFADGEYLKGDCNFGQLTQKGSAQHLALGAAFRSVYVDSYNFLAGQMNTSDLWVRSTNIYRTLQSAQSFLNGMFPPTSSASSPEVVQMETHDAQVETMYPNTDLCPRLTAAYKTAMETPEYMASVKQVQPYIELMQQVFNTTDLPDITGIYDAFNARICHGIPLPDGINSTVLSELGAILEWQFAFINAQTQVARLGIGALLSDMYHAMANALRGDVSPRFRLYSGHDTSVGPLLGALGINEGEYPPYAAHVIIELWQTANGPAVRIISEDTVMQLPTCGELCGWCDFQEIISPVLPTDYTAECAM